jgi:Domain of unknown function (DUF4440)
MNKIVGTLTAATLVLAVTHAQEKPGAKPDEKLLIANERALLDAVAKADKASYQSLILPEGVWTMKSGFVPMKLLADGLDGFKVTKWDIVNPHVIWLGDDSAIVNYAWTGAGTFDDHPLAPTTLAATVWMKRDNKWVAAHHQETDLIK